MQTFSQYFNLNKSQYELDFVDVPVNNGDIPLFIDPYSISRRNDYWSIDCHNSIVDFFQEVIDRIRSGDERTAKYMLSELGEPNQTRLGLSKGKTPRGRGVGGEQAVDLYDALADSAAVKTGFIKDLEECELLIDGIGKDKISDITTNIIRNKLIEYTQAQCVLWGISMNQVPSGFTWDLSAKRWTDAYIDLPVCYGRSVILIPKAIARFGVELNHQEYYQHFVLNFLQDEAMDARSSLVRTLRDGTKKPPTKKLLKQLHPLSKQYLYNFSKEHPEVLRHYEDSKGYLIREIPVEDLVSFIAENEDAEQFDFDSLYQKLVATPSGNAFAAEYHNHMIGVLTAIFYPALINPRKEQEIHEGRKRIDISFQNAAQEGFFHDLPTVKQVPSGYVFVECKNYTNDLANPELDQLAGRFSLNRGKFGILVCRKFKNKKLFTKRCRDTAQDGRGFIVPFDDDDIKELLEFRKKKQFVELNKFLDGKYRELVM